VISWVPVFWSWLGVVTRSKSTFNPRIVFAFSFCGSRLFFGLGGSSSLRHGEATAVLPSSRRLCLAYVCSRQGIVQREMVSIFQFDGFCSYSIKRLALAWVVLLTLRIFGEYRHRSPSHQRHASLRCKFQLSWCAAILCDRATMIDIVAPSASD